jgi:hypothetical protein
MSSLSRGIRVLAVLGAGAAFAALFYWSFLNTPESNALMLAVSALLLLSMAGSVAISLNLAVLVAAGDAIRAALATSMRGLVWFALVAVPLLLAWLAIAELDAWIARHQGEINAWFISQFEQANIAPLLTAEAWVSRWLRWAVLPLAGLSLLSSLLAGARARGRTWWRHTWHWRSLLTATAVFVLLFVMPWRLTAWRPAVPPTWVEPATAALRLGTTLLLGLVGATVLVCVAAAAGAPGRRPLGPVDPET